MMEGDGGLLAKPFDKQAFIHHKLPGRSNIVVAADQWL
jgi:hypothetical protein